MSDAATRLRAVPAAVVSDVLDGLGLRDQLLPHGIGPLAPGQTVCGPAFPIAGRTDAETAPEAGLRRYLEMLGHVPHGHVVVMAAGDETAAHFGELSATWVQARDCPGVVIDGGLRDIPVLRRMGYPIFCRYHSTRSIAGRWSPVSMGEPVEIGGVAHRPGRPDRRRRRRRGGRPGRGGRRGGGARRGDRRRGEPRAQRGGDGHAADRGVRPVGQLLAMTSQSRSTSAAPDEFRRAPESNRT